MRAAHEPPLRQGRTPMQQSRNHTSHPHPYCPLTEADATAILGYLPQTFARRRIFPLLSHSRPGCTRMVASRNANRVLAD
jgi:hypothetical protein